MGEVDKRNLFSVSKAIFEDNKTKRLTDWLEFETLFSSQGNQGVVGLVSYKKNKSVKYVFKISKYLGYLVDHEGSVLRGLNEVSSFCPHFGRFIGMVEESFDPFVTEDNPFKKVSKYRVRKKILFLEYIDSAVKLSSFLRLKTVDHEEVYSLVKQVLMGIVIGGDEKKFAHYDLHSGNVMVKKCSRDLVFLYILDSKNSIAIPSLGRRAVIIDAGFAYIEDLEDIPMWMSMGFTSGGMLSDRFDWVADPKLFLVTISGELKENFQTRKSLKLRNVVKNIFNCLDIDWFSGHDKERDRLPAAEYIRRMLGNFTNASKLFRDNGEYCVDFLTSLVITPIQKQSFDDIDVSYRGFIGEWIKIENEIGNDYFNMYILKGVVDAARTVRPAYNNPKTRPAAVQDFTKLIFAEIDSVVKFCRPKDLRIPVLLGCLLSLGKCIEGILYYSIKDIWREKKKVYRSLPLNSAKQIYGVVEANIGDSYTYNKNTQLCVIDVPAKQTYFSKLNSQETDMINETHFISRGTILSDILKTKTTNLNL